jgi:hypothetical protein
MTYQQTRLPGWHMRWHHLGESCMWVVQSVFAVQGCASFFAGERFSCRSEPAVELKPAAAMCTLPAVDPCAWPGELRVTRCR